MERLDEAHHSDPLLIAYLAERQLWLTQLRWIAIGGILGAVTVAARSGLITQALPLLLVVAFMGIYNLIFWRLSKAHSDQVSAPFLQKRVFLQVLLDLGALTTLLHLAGGVENPFVLFFAFHMAIAAMLLPLKMALYLGIAASVFHGASVFAEFARQGKLTTKLHVKTEIAAVYAEISALLPPWPQPFASAISTLLS